VAAAEDLRPALPTMLWRAVRRRCPRCAVRGAFFTSWFHRADRCPRCGYRWERHEGFVLGPITMNMVVTFGLVGVVLVVGLLVTLADGSPWPIIAAGVVVAVVVPIVIYPITWTLWSALDLRWSPLTDAEEADAAAHASTTNPSNGR
jgi:uncharacterized protein (DUF983 family)